MTAGFKFCPLSDAVCSALVTILLMSVVTDAGVVDAAGVVVGIGVGEGVGVGFGIDAGNATGGAKPAFATC